MVIGAMGAQKVLVYVPLQITVGQTTVIFQDVLNGLLPNMLPFGLIIGTWMLLKKKVSPVLVGLLYRGAWDCGIRCFIGLRCRN